MRARARSGRSTRVAAGVDDRRASTPAHSCRSTPGRPALPASRTVPRRRPRAGRDGGRRARRRPRRWSTGQATARPLQARDHLLGRLRSGPASTASMPPAWSRLRGERQPGGVGGDRAERGQEDLRPGAVAARCASERVAQPLVRVGRGGPAAARRRSARAPARGATGASARLGNSLTPVIGVAPAWRGRRRGAARCRAEPAGDAARSRSAAASAARALDLLEPRPGGAGQLVGERSTYQEPPAGSMTRARCDSSSSRTGCCGRSAGRTRRAGPSAASNGSTVTASAPPTPAAKPATVVRSMFTQGSRRVIIADEVTACWRCPAAAGDAPHASATRAHSRRAARSLAMVRNWSAVAAIAELQLPARVVDAEPGRRSARAGRRRRRRGRSRAPRRREPPASWTGGAVDDDHAASGSSAATRRASGRTTSRSGPSPVRAR